MLIGQIMKCESCNKTHYFSVDNPICECGWEWSPDGERKQNKTLYVLSDTINAYYDVGVSQEIESRSQIKRICKEKGYVYGGGELDQQAESNKRYQKQNIARGFEKFKDRIRYELM